MAAFYKRMRSSAGNSNPSAGSSPSKKDPNALQISPLERHLIDLPPGPLREDGSDKFWGLENFGNTCYCNSILQCLYYSVPFREHVINYPKRTTLEAVTTTSTGQSRIKVDEAILPPTHPSLTYARLMKQNPPGPNSARSPGVPPLNPKPEDKEHPDFKKRVALARGPMISMTSDNAGAYEMPESLFTSLKDIFDALLAHKSNVGVVSPNKFLEMLRKENEMFRSAMHQDAHEFLNLVLNEVVSNVEVHSRKLEESIGKQTLNGSAEMDGFQKALSSAMPKAASNSRWVHELFEGTLTSETKCLTCENVSQRDEAFLDLSVDLDEHSSVTACLRKFSEEEMLCERNKFHCDRCGGLQEAEKRMKIKRLPKILALHLKRFKYTEDLQRLQKLFHRVVYPYHLRLFNTTDDAEDPDRLYELYAVVVHIGGGPYHGHYISIIKTQDRGWLLFDDELVEPVDKSYVQNFFGDRPGLACAYVLFYQETTLEAVKREQDAESAALAAKAIVENPKEPIGLGLKTNGFMNGIHHVKSAVTPSSPNTAEAINVHDSLDKAVTEPPPSSQGAPPTQSDMTALPQISHSAISPEDVKSKKEKAKEEKDRKAIAKISARQEEKAEAERRKNLLKKQDADMKAAIEASRLSHEDSRNGNENGSANTTPAPAISGHARGLSRFTSTSKSFRKSKVFSRDASKDEHVIIDEDEPGHSPSEPTSKEKLKNRFSSLRRKSSNMKLL